MRGNVLDMAVGIIIGAAFGRIVSSMVSDMLMPPLGLLLGRVDFSSLFINLSDAPDASLAAARTAGAPTLNYGVFIQTVLDFLIIGFVIFLHLRQDNVLTNKPEVSPGPATTKSCSYCLSTIPIKATRCQHCTSELKTA